MNVRWTRRAFRDREDILSYVSARSPSGARNVLERFEAACILIAEQPLVGLPTDIADVRVLFVGRYPYKLFYRLRGNAVEILHIRHTSRTKPRSI